MSVIIESIPIRLQLGIVSNPPVAPVDRNTGELPKLWAGCSVAFQIGIFTAEPVAVDLSNLAYLQVILQESEGSTAPLVVKQIDAADIKDTITLAAWLNGSDQQATAIFTPADTDQSLAGALSRNFWLVVQGYTEDGAPLVYGGGTVTISKPSYSLPAPPPPSFVSRHAQTTVENDVTVTPTSQFHTEVVTVSGAARTFNVLLGINGIYDGAQLALILNLPATADIIALIKNQLSTNPTISSVQTGSVLQALLEYYFDADAVAWIPKFYALPPT